MKMNRTLLALVLAFTVAGCSDAIQQRHWDARTGSSQQKLGDHTNLAGQTGVGPSVIVRHIEQNGNAVTIDLAVEGVELTAPQPNMPLVQYQGHIEYSVDSGKKQDATSTRIQVPNLPPGEHKIEVGIANNGHHEFGEPKTVVINVKG